MEQKINLIVEKHLYRIDEGRILDFIKNFKNQTEQQVINLLKSSWKSLLKIIKSEDKEKEALDIINKSLGTKYRSLDDFNKVQETADPKKEGFVNWLKSMAFQGTMTASIFSGLQIFFELDKIFDGTSMNLSKILVYSFLWILFSTKAYQDWRKGM